MRDHDRLLQLFNHLKAVNVCSAKDRPYLILSILVIRRALVDSQHDPKTVYRDKKQGKMTQRITQDAIRFLGGSGLDTWLRATGLYRFTTAQKLRELAMSGARLPESRLDVHDYSNV